jgi:enolase-phosphatase E1
MLHRSGISHLLLDIEGTTCPVSFVANTLFPYAATHLEAFLLEHSHDEVVSALITDVQQAWQQDDDPTARALRAGLSGTSSTGPDTAAGTGTGANTSADSSVAALAAYLRLLIEHDRKLTALKQLQGLIWEAGYSEGALVAPLFDDVAPALQGWHAQGLVLAVYSSGSVGAQQLLYGHCREGDLRPLFRHWFDTRMGPKQEAASYTAIAQAMEVVPGHVLFISDALAECTAAASSGMAVLFSDRPSNPHRDAGPFEKISDYRHLQIA